MRWIDRCILLSVGAGLWALVGTYMLDERHAVAQTFSVDDVICDAVRMVGSRCTVHGEVYIFSAEFGEIEGGYLSC